MNCRYTKSTILTAFDKATVWLLLLSPILGIYGVGPFNLCTFITWIVILLGLLKQRLNMKLRPVIRYYFIYLSFVTFISCVFSAEELIGRGFGVVHSFLLFALFFSIKDFDLLYKSYKVLALISLGLFYAQEISFTLTGIRISGLIPFLPINSSLNDASNTYTFQELLTLVYRSSSFFSEPAHFAQFLLPLLPLSLYLENGRKRIFYFIITITALFLLKSGNGIIGLIAIMVAFFVFNFKKMSLKYIAIISVCLLCLGVFGIKFIVNSESGQKYNERYEEMFAGSNVDEDASGFTRIYPGYYVYAEYDTFEKVFGINNFGVIQAKMKLSRYGYLLDGVLYFNTVQHFLLKAGIIGLFFFLFMLIDIYRGNNYCGKTLVIVFLLLSLISSIYLTPTMILYFLFGYGIKERDLNHNNQNISKVCITK